MSISVPIFVGYRDDDGNLTPANASAAAISDGDFLPHRTRPEVWARMIFDTVEEYMLWREQR